MVIKMGKREYFIIAFILLGIFLTGCSYFAVKNDRGSDIENMGVAAEMFGSEEKYSEDDSKKAGLEQANEKFIQTVKLTEGNFGIINDAVVDVYKSASSESERVTQALYNQPVEILQETAGWISAKVEDGYIGWIQSDHIVRVLSSIQADNYKFNIMITGKTKKVYSDFKGQDLLKEIVMGTRLYALQKHEDWYEVVLPKGIIGWIDGFDTVEIREGSNMGDKSVTDFISTLNKFIDTKYLWGGVSSYGLDCSGLTYICSRANGVVLPRDAEPQFSFIEHKISKESIEPGDLVFFSSGEDLKGVSHVGVYIGNNEFIHASKSAGKVIISSIKSDYFNKRFVGAGRIF